MDRNWIVGHIMRPDKWESADPSKISNWSTVCNSKDEAEAVLASILADINLEQREDDATEYESAEQYNESSNWGFLILTVAQGEESCDR